MLEYFWGVEIKASGLFVCIRFENQICAVGMNGFHCLGSDWGLILVLFFDWAAWKLRLEGKDRKENLFSAWCWMGMWFDT